MARSKGAGEQTRRKLLDIAEFLFAKKGYSATGVQELLRESGAPRGSFYFHYPNGKAQLATEAMRSSATTLQKILLEQFTPDMNRQDKLKAAFVAFHAYLVSKQHEVGCPTATIALEAPTEELQAVAQDIYKEWEQLIREHIGMEEHEASALLCAIEGALLLSKVYGHTDPLRAVARQYDIALPETSDKTGT